MLRRTFRTSKTNVWNFGAKLLECYNAVFSKMRPSKLRGMLLGLPYKLFPGFPVRFVIFSPVFRRGITVKSGFQALDFALTVFRIHFTLSSKSTLFLLVVFLLDLIQNSSALRTIPGAHSKRRTRYCYCGTHKAVYRPSRIQDFRKTWSNLRIRISKFSRHYIQSLLWRSITNCQRHWKYYLWWNM